MIPRGEWRLRTTLVLLLALATLGTLVTLLVVAGGLFLWRLPQVRLQSVAQVQHEAQQLAERTEILLESTQRQLEVASAMLEERPQDVWLAVLDALTDAGRQFEAVYVADRNGIVEAVSVVPEMRARRGELLGSDISANRLYRLASERGMPVWSNKFLSALSGRVTVGVAIPVSGRTLIGEVSLEELLRTLHMATKDRRLSVWLIDGRGELVAQTGAGAALGPANLLGLPVVRSAIEGHALPQIVTMDGEEFHPAVARSAMVEWFFLVRMPAGLNDPDIRSTSILLAIALFSSLLVGTLLAPVVANWMARPMQAIIERARRVADGMPGEDWPRGRIWELNQMAADLESIAKRLQERHVQFQAIFNASPAPMALVDEAAGALVDANEAWLRQFRRSGAETIGRPFRDQPLWVSESDFAAAMRTASDGHQRVEVALQDGEGHRLVGECSRRLVVIGGSALAIWVIEDITQRKTAEELIRRNNTVLQALTRVQQEFIIAADPDRAFERILTLLLETTSSEYGFIGEVRRQPGGQPYLKTHAISNIAWNEETRDFYDRYAPAGLEFHNVNTLFGHVLRTCEAVIANDPVHDPRRGGLPPGHPPLRAFVGIPFFHAADLIGMVGLANRPGGYHAVLLEELAPVLATCSGLIRASTLERERREALEALRRSEGRLAEAQQVAQLGSWELDLEKGDVEWSGEGYRLFDLDPAASRFSLDDLEGRIHPVDRELVRRTMAQVILSSAPLETEFRVIRSDGEVRWLQSRGRTVCDLNGKAIRIVGTSQDITARKNAEEALRQSRAQLDSILGSLEDVIWSVTADGAGMLYLNPAAERLYGRSVAELFARPNLWREMVDARDAAAVAEAWEQVRRSGEGSVEYRIVRPDGAIRWVRDRSRVVKDADGEPIRIDGIGTDITERKEADERVRSALAEKDVLLKEVYHRVKNNLQVVSSLLNLQSRRTTDGETRRLLDDAASRVRSMAMVHEQLYRSERLASIRLREYLAQLVSNLSVLHGPLSRHVRLRMEADDLFLDIGSAIPLGLIVNELVSNAYRHAFPVDATEGEIVVRITGLADGRIRLLVEDDGCGLPPNFGLGTRASLGLQLVAMLTQQLSGQLHWNARPQGASFTLEFKGEPSPPGRRITW